MTRIKMPTLRPNRLRKWVIILLSVTAFIVLVGAAIGSRYASGQIKQRLTALGCNVGSVNVNILTRTVTISNIDYTRTAESDSSVSVTAYLKNAVVKNIGLYDILVNKELTIKEVMLTDGGVDVRQKKTKTKPSVKKTGSKLKKISIGRIVIQNIKATLGEDSLKQYSGLINLTLTNVQSSDTASISSLRAYSVRNIQATIDKVLIKSGSGFYETRIGTVMVETKENKLRLDSLTLIPKYSKYKFSRVAGKQTDRVNAFVRSIEITGVQFDQINDSIFIASKIVIVSPEVYSFRDKRMTFKEQKNKPLPIAALKEFNFDVEIDSIQIKDSKITYEEFPEEGFESGKIVFEDLQATMANVSNKHYANKPPYATLEATSKIMGKGAIHASFRLPLEEERPYHAKGNISRLPLHHLNPALENLAFIKIESGTLNDLNFDFEYNDKASNGTLTINYEDLKITGLKKEKSPDENDFKTFLINTIVKNDKDKDVPLDKRTGVIEFERDRKRQIFNFWWKSLLSGIKTSVLNSDKASEKSKKERKKK
ncbi:MAG TPA: DUF748 domain-containing protein [Chryseolinea sp.]